MNGLKTLYDRLTLYPEGHCLLGLSGGADSVALMRMLLPDVKDGRLRLSAVHVDHGLRGAESDGDAAFAERLCGENGIPFYLYRADLKGRADEAAAREARYACFRACMKETGADALLLAHHRDDLAETFMLRLLRGAGPEGLGCMSDDGVVDGMRILRPMLRIGRDDIRRALAEENIPWREDASNEDDGYLRNAVRHELLPLMERLAPGAGARVARTAELTAADNALLDARAAAFLDRYAGNDWIERAPLMTEDPAIRARILRTWWKRWTPRLDEHALNAEQTAALTALAGEDRGKVNLPAGCFAAAGKRFLHLTDGAAPDWGETPCGEDGGTLGPYRLTRGKETDGPGDGKFTQTVPEGFLEGCTLRTRRPGDRIRPFGMKGSRKLQDYLTDRGIDAVWRDRIPLLCRGNEVLLAAGVGAGGIPGWNREEKSVRLEWHGDMPWAGEGE